MQFIQSILLSDLLIFIVLFAVFFLLSNWALRRLQEYAGYALGWLVALFFMVVYSSLAGSDPANLEALNASTRLNVFQVLLASILGIGSGLGAMLLVRMRSGHSTRQALNIAMLTAVNVILLFLMFVAGSQARRMIGIYALGFGIAALFTVVLLRSRDNRSSPSDGPDRFREYYEEAREGEESDEGLSTLDRMRRGLRNNRGQR